MVRNPFNRTALLIIDMQEDFCSEQGAYARGGMDIRATRAIIPMVDSAIRGAQTAGIVQIGTLFTVFEDVEGCALLSPHLQANRPFLKAYGFRVGEQGRAFSHEITSPSHVITKPRYSAFYGTPLDILIRDMAISQVVVCGITANGGVAATVRDAYLRDLNILVLADAVASFSEEVKQRSLADMGDIAKVKNTCEWLSTL